MLEASGFPQKSQGFAGKVSEPAPLQEMIQGLHDVARSAADRLATVRPVGVLDAGIATAANIEWLRAEDDPYRGVSRKRPCKLCEEEAIRVKDEPGAQVKGPRGEHPETAEVERCHAQGREQTERSLQTRFSKR